MGWRIFLMTCVLFAACQRHKPPPPPPDRPAPVVATDNLPVGVAACDDYLKRVAACTKLSPAARETLARGASVWRAAASSKSLPATCEGVAKTASAELDQLGC